MELARRPIDVAPLRAQDLTGAGARERGERDEEAVVVGGEFSVPVAPRWFGGVAQEPQLRRRQHGQLVRLLVERALVVELLDELGGVEVDAPHPLPVVEDHRQERERLVHGADAGLHAPRPLLGPSFSEPGSRLEEPGGERLRDRGGEPHGQLVAEALDVEGREVLDLAVAEVRDQVRVDQLRVAAARARLDLLLAGQVVRRQLGEPLTLARERARLHLLDALRQERLGGAPFLGLVLEGTLRCLDAPLPVLVVEVRDPPAAPEFY